MCAFNINKTMNNIIVIILGILFLLMIYVIYRMYFYGSGSGLTTKTVSLLDNTPPIMNDKLKNSGSTNFAYGAWIYVNTWSGNNKTIFYLDPNGAGVSSAINQPLMVGTPKYPDFSIGLDKNTPSLYCTMGATTPFKIKLTDAFPVQKWVFVVVSLDGNVLDCYLDGKLIVSSQLSFVDFMNTVKNIGNDNIYLGDCDPAVKNDIFVTQFNRWDHALDPRTVWNLYLTGNGYNYSTSGNYAVKLNVTKDNAPQTEIRLY